MFCFWAVNAFGVSSDRCGGRLGSRGRICEPVDEHSGRSPKRTKAWKALGKIGACAETTITKIADRFDEPLSPTPFKPGETLDKDGEPMMDQGTYVQYQNGAEQIDFGVECRRGPFQAGRPRPALHGPEAEEMPARR